MKQAYLSISGVVDDGALLSVGPSDMEDISLIDPNDPFFTLCRLITLVHYRTDTSLDRISGPSNT